jgi:hypothetical protein
LDDLQRQQNQFSQTGDPQSIGQQRLLSQESELQSTDTSSSQNLDGISPQNLRVTTACFTNCSVGSAVIKPSSSQTTPPLWLGLGLILLGVVMLVVIARFFGELKLKKN